MLTRIITSIAALAVFAAALVPESTSDAVQHIAAIAADAPYQEVRHAHQL